MSEHTTKTDKVIAIPHEERTSVTLVTLDEIEHDIDHVKYLQKKQNDILLGVIKKIDKLRLVLEAK